MELGSAASKGGSELAEFGAKCECEGPRREFFIAMGSYDAGKNFGGELGDKGVGGGTGEIAATAFELDAQGVGPEGKDYLGGTCAKHSLEYTADFKKGRLVHRDLK